MAKCERLVQTTRGMVVVGHPLLAPLLPTEHESGLHAMLLGLRHATMASDQELLALVENAVEALAVRRRRSGGRAISGRATAQ